jgi:hypothetical protein
MTPTPPPDGRVAKWIILAALVLTLLMRLAGQ